MMRFGLTEKIIAKLLLWRQIATQRAELNRLSDELLKDIGISRADAAYEASRHFWDTESVEAGLCRDRAPAVLRYKYN